MATANDIRFSKLIFNNEYYGFKVYINGVWRWNLIQTRFGEQEQYELRVRHCMKLLADFLVKRNYLYFYPTNNSHPTVYKHKIEKPNKYKTGGAAYRVDQLKNAVQTVIKNQGVL